MATELAEHRMADSDKKRDDETVRIERSIVRKARSVVALRQARGEKIILAEYLSAILDAHVSKDFAAELKRAGS